MSVVTCRVEGVQCLCPGNRLSYALNRSWDTQGAGDIKGHRKIKPFANEMLMLALSLPPQLNEEALAQCS